MIRLEVEQLLTRVSYKPNFAVAYNPTGYWKCGDTPGRYDLFVDEQEDAGPHRVWFVMYVPDCTVVDVVNARPVGAPRRHVLVPQAPPVEVCAEYRADGRQLFRQDLDLISVQQTSLVPSAIDTVDDFFAWVKAEILRLEQHESDEWFKIDGAAANSPHPKYGGFFVPSEGASL